MANRIYNALKSIGRATISGMAGVGIAGVVFLLGGASLGKGVYNYTFLRGVYVENVFKTYNEDSVRKMIPEVMEMERAGLERRLVCWDLEGKEFEIISTKMKKEELEGQIRKVREFQEEVYWEIEKSKLMMGLGALAMAAGIFGAENRTKKGKIKC